MKYLRENDRVKVTFVDGKPISIEVPDTIDLVVKDTPPAMKGATATNQYKDAILENGLTVQVPPFIGPGDKVRVDTRTDEYIERVK
jgi:elongation factor P